MGEKRNKGIDSIPNIFKYRVSKIKNRNVKREMNSDIANMVLDEAQNRINKRFSDSLFFKKMGGMSNFQIENVIVNIGDDDLKKNFVGAFPSNYVYKFIDHASMISRKGKYPLIIANKDSSEKPGVYWWSILDIEPKLICFFQFCWFRWTKALLRAR